jgi:hypothetical protein
MTSSLLAILINVELLGNSYSSSRSVLDVLPRVTTSRASATAFKSPSRLLASALRETIALIFEKAYLMGGRNPASRRQKHKLAVSRLDQFLHPPSLVGT